MLGRHGVRGLVMVGLFLGTGLFLIRPGLRIEGKEDRPAGSVRTTYRAYDPAKGPAGQVQRVRVVPRTASAEGGVPRSGKRLSPERRESSPRRFFPTGSRWFSRRDSAASERKEGKADEEFDPTAETVRLTFLNANWRTVLQKVADASHSVLVMNKIPPGRFSRYDRRKYTRKEAVRILNRELESKGFRLVEKGKFLDVLYLRDARATYHRPEWPGAVSRNAAPLPVTRPQQEPQRQRSGVHHISRDGISVSGGSADYPAVVRRATHLQLPSAAGARTRGNMAAGKAPGILHPAAQGHPVAKPIIRVVRPRHRSAVDLARAIYRPLKNRADLLDRGPGGHPAFRVYEPQPITRQGGGKSHTVPAKPSGRPLFTVGIDTVGERLFVEAPPRQNEEVVRLIQHLDSLQLAHGEILKIVDTQSPPTPIAQALRPQLALLVQHSGQQPGASQPGNRQPAEKKPPGKPSPAKRPGGKQPMGQPTPGKQPGAPTGGEPGGVIPIIRGRVTIRDVPGVGLVITGNKEDVEAVLRIIRELDRQGLISVPNIHVQPLRYVNSQALAELLSAVYQQLATIRTGQTQQVGSVGFIPVIRPNVLLIISSQAGLPAIQKLITELDRPIDPTKEYRVFHLQFAVASQVVANLDALFQQQQQQGTQTTRGLAARVRAIADVRTNAVIIEASPNDMTVVARLIDKLDRERINSVSRMRIFRLKNAVATELADLINSAIQSVLNPPTVTGQTQGAVGTTGGQGAQQLRDVKASVLEFMVDEGNRRRLVRSGILSDIRVTADSRINAIVVTAPEMSMQLMEQLIRQLDQPSSLVAEIKVFTLANGDATAMVNLLQSLFPEQSAGGQQQGQPGIQVASADDASSGLIPLRFTVDPRTNSVIAVGGAEALRVVEAVIFRLDESDVRQRQTTVIKLRNSPVADVANAINQFLQSQRDLAQIDPNIVTNMELLEREIIVVPEPVSNSLLISATPRYYDEIRQIVDRLDQAPPQVVIQALLVEVELDNTDEFGIELGFQDDILFDRGVLGNLQTLTTTTTLPTGVQTTTQDIISSERTPGFNFNNQPLGNNAATHPSSVGTQGLSNFSLGRVNADLGFGGLVVSAQSSSLSVLLRALAAKRTVHILSRPQITTLDNQLAQIQVGQQVPVTDGVTTTGTGTANPVIRQQPTGIILTVTPRIRPDNTIVMETVAEKSSLAGQGVPIFTDAQTGNVIESPIINITTARTTVAVPNGQTIVLGGMITKEDDTIERKVPWLGDLPVVKYAFRYDSTRTRRTELLIFLTPRIVKDDADAEIIKQIESERLHFIEQDAEAVHGPLFAVPPDNAATLPRPLSQMRRPTMDKPGWRLPAFDDGSIPTTDVSPTGYQPPTNRAAIDGPDGNSSRTYSGSEQHTGSSASRAVSVTAGANLPQSRPSGRRLFRLPWNKAEARTRGREIP